MKALITILVILLSSMAFAQDSASVDLNWTAPGDDGNVGTAFVYVVRYSVDDSLKLINDWENCTFVSGPPTPDIAGTAQVFSFIVPEVPSSSVVYVAIKTADETFANPNVTTNWSGLSNIARFTAADIIPPAAIEDLRITITFTLRVTP